MEILRTGWLSGHPGRSVPCCQCVVQTTCHDARERGTTNEPSHYPSLPISLLEVQLQSQLDQSRITCSFDSPKIGSIRRVPVGLKELRMVEHVEKFAPEFHPESFVKLRHFLETYLPVVDAGAAANRARGITDRPGRNGILRETIVRIESGIDQLAVHARSRSRAGTEGANCLLRIDRLERRNHVWLTRSFEIEAGLQLDITLLRDAYREARLKRRNPRYCPAVQSLSLKSFILWYR